VKETQNPKNKNQINKKFDIFKFDIFLYFKFSDESRMNRYDPKGEDDDDDDYAADCTQVVVNHIKSQNRSDNF